MENVVLVSFDSLRSDYVAQISPAEAPSLCLIRDRGAFFKNAIVQAPFTIPSHASMLTGLYPARTGVRDMHHRIAPEVPSVFSILNEAGFYVMASSPTALLRRGGKFRGIDRHVPSRYRCLKKSIVGLNGKRFFAFLHHWGTHTPYQTRLPGWKPMDVVSNLLRPFCGLGYVHGLRRIGDALWLYRVERIRTMLKNGNKKILPALKRGYRDALIKADKFLGRVLKILEEADLANKTLLIITGDHGDSFSEHGEINRAIGGRYEHGQFLYDNTIRVPLIFFSGGRRFSRAFDAQIQEIDIAPTLLEALGVEYEGTMDGTSRWTENMVGGKEPNGTFAFSEVVRESLDIQLRCVRSSSFKLIYDYGNNTFEFYDLRADPQEKNNLYPADTYRQKDALLAQLHLFSQINRVAGESCSGSEQKQIEQMLRNLGYLR